MTVKTFIANPNGVSIEQDAIIYGDYTPLGRLQYVQLATSPNLTPYISTDAASKPGLVRWVINTTAPVQGPSWVNFSIQNYDPGPFANNIVYPQDFGAVGDGITDDTAAIQAALDAASSGGVVLFPRGIYLVSAGLTCPYSGVILQGVGGVSGKEGYTPVNGAVLLASSDAFTTHEPIILFGTTSSSDIILGSGISRLNVNCNGVADGVWLASDDQGFAIDCFIVSAYSCGLYAVAFSAGGVDSVRFTRCKVAETGDGTNSLGDIGTPQAAIALGQNVYYGVIDKCSTISSAVDGTIIGNPTPGAGESDGCKIIGCNSDTTAGNQFAVYSGDNHVVANNTTFNPAGKSALFLSGGGNHVISGNFFEGSNNANNQTGGTGAIIYNSGGRDIVVVGNVIGESSAIGHATAGIYEEGVNTAPGSLYVNNSLLGCVEASVTPVIVQGSTVSLWRDNPGYNPVGLETVAVPASGSATAALPYDATFYITASTSTVACAVTDAGGTSQTVATIPSSGFGAVFVPAGSTLTPTYTVAPTWTVQGH